MARKTASTASMTTPAVPAPTAPRRRGRPPKNRTEAGEALSRAWDAIANISNGTSTGAKVPMTRPAPSLTPDDPAIREATRLLKLVADPTRLCVLLTLTAGARNVTQLCGDLGMEIKRQPAMSLHLSILRHARLVEPRQSGKFKVYDVSDEGRALATMMAGLVGTNGAE